MMSAATFLNILSPKVNKFYLLFDEDVENLFHMAELFNELINSDNASQWAQPVKKIKEFELAGDKITIQIFYDLSTTFMTPIDREDIHSLATDIEDMANNINDASQRISRYKPRAFVPELPTLAALILEAVKQIKDGIKHLRNMRNTKALTDIYDQVKKVQNQAEDLHNLAISNLFKKETDTIQLIKSKDILEAFEQAIHKIKDVADVFKAIVSKHL